MPGVAPIVVVESDSLAVWTGLVGALGGVVLGAGLDWLRTRAAERKRTRTELMLAGTEFVSNAGQYVRAIQAAAKAEEKAPWIAVQDAREAAINAAIDRISLIKDKELDKAVQALVTAAMTRPPGEDQDALNRRQDETSVKLEAFRDAVNAAKL
jgi:hypothetical protein